MGARPAAEPLVVLLHGLWCNRLYTRTLSRRLHRCGFRVARFNYSSVRRSPAQNAAALQRWLQRFDADQIHFVAHSLGGLVLCHLFAGFPEQRPGRLVFLGTPLRGSQCAKRVAALPGGRMVLGASLERGLLGDGPLWPADRETGSIAGTVGVGLGVLVGGFRATCDGAVAVAETQSPDLTDHVEVRTSHTGLLFSPAAARQVCAFLQTGRFLRSR